MGVNPQRSRLNLSSSIGTMKDVPRRNRFVEIDGVPRRVVLAKPTPRPPRVVPAVLVKPMPRPRHFSTSAPRHLGAAAPRRIGASTPRHFGTSAPRHIGASTPRHIGTSAPRHLGTSARGHRNRHLDARNLELVSIPARGIIAYIYICMCTYLTFAT